MYAIKFFNIALNVCRRMATMYMVNGRCQRVRTIIISWSQSSLSLAAASTAVALSTLLVVGAVGGALRVARGVCCST